MKRIKLTQSKYAIVDDEDFERINQFKWCAACEHGYWRAVRHKKETNGKQIIQRMHRLIMNVPKRLQVDHRNYDGLDNRKSNLRICTHAENLHNQRPQKRKTSSQYKGVCWYKQGKKWLVKIRSNNRRIYLGCFTNEIAAAYAYDKKAKELFGEFAYLNFKEVSNG